MENPVTAPHEQTSIAVATQADLSRAARDVAASLVRAIAEDVGDPADFRRPWALLASRRARFRQESWRAQIEDAVLQVFQAGNEALAAAVAKLEQCKDELRRTEAQINALKAEVDRLQRTAPDDLRDAGLTLAIHADGRSGGELRTSWLFVTPDGRALRGEAHTDAEALDQIRAALS